MGKEPSYTGRRNPRFVTVRRGGTLEDLQHRLLAAWAADCPEQVLKEYPHLTLEDVQAYLAYAARLPEEEIGVFSEQRDEVLNRREHIALGY